MRHHHPHSRLAFLTGTPIANSVAEAFHMLRYLYPEGLKERGVQHFDHFIRTFAEISEEMEIDFAGASYKSKRRLRNFANLKGLQTLYHAVTDSISNDMLQEMFQDDYGMDWPIPNIKNGKPTLVDLPRSEIMAGLFNDILQRMEAITAGDVDPKEDNLLNCLNDARLSSLDVRIRGEGMDVIDPYSKVETSVGEILRIHGEWEEEKGTQLVFCDLSTPKSLHNDHMDEIAYLTRSAAEGDVEAADRLELLQMSFREDNDFDVYHELKKRLIERSNGKMDASQIAFIHEAKNQMQREKLFEDVRNGDVRVLIGSTKKMGLGMNVQHRLVAVHELDAPWRPCDVEQREGRILRQGNLIYEKYKERGEVFEIEILRYGTEKTTDAFLWQTLEVKKKAQERLETGDVAHGEVIDEDLSDTIVSFAAMKALTSGNPLILEEIEVRTELMRLRGKAAQHEGSINKYRSVIYSLSNHREITEAKIEVLKRAAQVAEDNPAEYFQGGPFFGEDAVVCPLKKDEDESQVEFEQRQRNWRGIVSNALTTCFSSLRGDPTEQIHHFKYRGLDVYMESKNSLVYERAYQNIMVRVIFEGMELARRDYDPDAKFGPMGLLATLRSAVRNLAAQQDSYWAKIASDEISLQDAMEMVNEPFAEEEQLLKLERRHREVCSELGLDTYKDALPLREVVPTPNQDATDADSGTLKVGATGTPTVYRTGSDVEGDDVFGKLEANLMGQHDNRGNDWHSENAAIPTPNDASARLVEGTRLYRYLHMEENDGVLPRLLTIEGNKPADLPHERAIVMGPSFQVCGGIMPGSPVYDQVLEVECDGECACPDCPDGQIEPEGSVEITGYHLFACMNCGSTFSEQPRSDVYRKNMAAYQYMMRNLMESELVPTLDVFKQRVLLATPGRPDHLNVSIHLVDQFGGADSESDYEGTAIPLRENSVVNVYHTVMQRMVEKAVLDITGRGSVEWGGVQARKLAADGNLKYTEWVATAPNGAELGRLSGDVVVEVLKLRPSFFDMVSLARGNAYHASDERALDTPSEVGVRHNEW